MELDHVALVVADLEETEGFYIDVLGFEQYFHETVASQGVKVSALRAGHSFVELLLPLDADSPLAKYLGSARTKLHHTAYRVPDLDAALAQAKARGVRLIDEVGRPGALGRRVAFLHPRSTHDVLIELCENASGEQVWQCRCSGTSP